MRPRVLRRQVWLHRAVVNTSGKALSGTLAGACVAVVLTLWCGSRPWHGTAAEVASLTKAYEALEQGKAQEAEALFQPLLRQADPGVKSQAYTGLAAVAFTHNDYAQTLDLARQAEAMDADIIYSHVLRGHVLLHQGKTDEAAAAYRTAIEKTRGFPWQKAMAHNRLGRIADAGGNAQQALAHYDQALSLPHHSQQEQVLTYTNKGHVLEKLGQYREALALYRQAQVLQPDNRFTGTLLHEAERRAQLTQDQEKQARLDTLVAELLKMHKEGRAQPDQGDGWTSPLLTLAFLPLQAHGTVSARAGEDDVLRLRLVEAVQSTRRITVVERDILDKVLAELKLSAAELIDPQAAVHLGRILAARLLVSGSFTRLGTEAQLSLRVVETETTRLQATVTEIVALPLAMDEVVGHLSTMLLHKVRAAYPVQGRIVQVAPAGLLLNIGAEHGMTRGLRLEVFGAEAPLSLDGKVIAYDRPRVGLIEVTSLQAQFAQATVVEQTTPFRQGWKVKEVQGP